MIDERVKIIRNSSKDNKDSFENKLEKLFNDVKDYLPLS